MFCAHKPLNRKEDEWVKHAGEGYVDYRESKSVVKAKHKPVLAVCGNNMPKNVAMHPQKVPKKKTDKKWKHGCR